MIFGTVHSKHSKNPTANLNAFCNSCLKIAYFSSEVDLLLSVCGQRHPEYERAILLVYPLFIYVNFALHLTPRTKI